MLTWLCNLTTHARDGSCATTRRSDFAQIMTNTRGSARIYSTDFDKQYLEEEEILRQCERFGFEYDDELSCRQIHLKAARAHRALVCLTNAQAVG